MVVMYEGIIRKQEKVVYKKICRSCDEIFDMRDSDASRPEKYCCQACDEKQWAEKYPFMIG